jgi:hypothetical protein
VAVAFDHFDLTAEDLRRLGYTGATQDITSIQAGLTSGQTDEELLPLFARLAERVADGLIGGEHDLLDYIGLALAGVLSAIEQRPAIELALGTLRSMAIQGVQRGATPFRTIEPGSQLHKFLQAIVRRPGIGTAELEKALEVTSAAPVSRVGRRLEVEGLARRVRRGRTTLWYPTPTGSELLQRLQEGSRRRAAPSARRQPAPTSQPRLPATAGQGPGARPTPKRLVKTGR